MTEEPRDDEDDTRVIFSLSVHSLHPIAAFVGVPGRKRPARPDDDHFYDFGGASFADGNWETRADKLDEIVNAALDRLDATGIQPAELAQENVTVKAFFTFFPGSETIQPDVVRRLARIHAVIWIDATA